MRGDRPFHSPLQLGHNRLDLRLEATVEEPILVKVIRIKGRCLDEEKINSSLLDKRLDSLKIKAVLSLEQGRRSLLYLGVVLGMMG